MRAIFASSYGGPEVLLAGVVVEAGPFARGLAVDDRVVLTHALS